MPVELPRIELPPIEPRDKPGRIVNITVAAIPIRALYALYVALGCCLVMIAAQGFVIVALARRLGWF